MEQKLKQSKERGNLSEAAFEFVYSHLIKRKATTHEDYQKHFDFILKSGKTVDIKNKRRLRSDGLVCVEVVNVTGGIGWCHPLSLVDYIAFETDDDFVIVQKQDLLKILPDQINSNILRKDHIEPKSLLGKFGGRESSQFNETNQDVFTYVYFKDIEKLKIELS